MDSFFSSMSLKMLSFLINLSFKKIVDDISERILIIIRSKSKVQIAWGLSFFDHFVPHLQLRKSAQRI
jgi:hypothetical protein